MAITMKGKIIGALSATGAFVSYQARKGTMEYLSELSGRIETFQKSMSNYERRLCDAFVSKFKSIDGVLEIIYDDGKPVVMQSGLDQSKVPTSAEFEFRKFWMHGDLYFPDDIKTASVKFSYPDSRPPLEMNGSELFDFFDRVVTYARGLRLEYLRGEQDSHLYALTAETFIFLASIGLFAYNLYHCIPAIKEDFGWLRKRLYSIKAAMGT